MKQMGISQQEIPSSRVIIEKTDNSRIIINNPSVVRISMHGQETFQISGELSEENPKPEISEDDIKTIVQQTGASEAHAKEILEETGDLAEAIMKLSEKQNE